MSQNVGDEPLCVGSLIASSMNVLSLNFSPLFLFSKYHVFHSLR